MRENKDIVRVVLVLLGVGLVMLAIGLMLMFLMKGEERVSGGVTGYSFTTSITCEAENYRYPFFEYDWATKTETRMSAIYDGDTMKSISFSQTVYYPNDELIKKAEVQMHATINASLREDGLVADSFDAAYITLLDSVKYSLYSDAENINESGGKYFLFSNVKAKDIRLEILNDIYVQNGFSCIETK